VHEREPIARARQGDQGAWQALVRTHQGAAFRLAYLLLGNADDAEDVAQEAFIRAFRALDRFDADRPFRPWLLRIVANLAHNRRRSIARYLAALERLFRAEPEAREAGHGPDLEQTEEAQLLWRAVGRLKPADQEVIYLRYFLDLPVEETAGVVGVPPGTVKSRLHRALARLETVVENEFPLLREGRGT
jgi:RNA polymerase sigma-70 factor (ECF subfamily)